MVSVNILNRAFEEILSFVIASSNNISSLTLAHIRCLFFFRTGSWVKLDGSFRNGNGAQHSPVISEDGAVEDLLAEAVEEQSKQGSR